MNMPADSPHLSALTRINRDLKKYRNLPERGIGFGVCSGIAYWRGWPTWAVRVVFFLFIFGAGVGLLAYLLVGCLAMEAPTPDDYNQRTGSE
jgi:phage shock protein PspC (stress-responsive transcriptional regulator)